MMHTTRDVDVKAAAQPVRIGKERKFLEGVPEGRKRAAVLAHGADPSRVLVRCTG
jgi:hypothetical protein